MSMMRASGAILRMTALHRATASLAVPKSVMKTMEGLFGAACTESLGAGALVHAEKHAASSRVAAASARRSEQRDMKFPFIRCPSISATTAKTGMRRADYVGTFPCFEYT